MGLNDESLVAAVCLVGIVAICVLEGYALYQGVDGTTLAAALAAIGTMVGIFLRHIANIIIERRKARIPPTQP